jgi:dTDP-4-dehydrorhamnose reductase
MNIIVLGATGMLGHITGLFLKENFCHQVFLSAREKTGHLLLDESLLLLDLRDTEKLQQMIEDRRPCVIVNCSGLNDVRRGQKALDEINADLPHQLVKILEQKKDGSRLIHISTDGVFRGDRGQYSEGDIPDPDDLYGKSKRAGEIIHAPHLTIRTSIVGPDPVHSRGIMSWFFSQTGEVAGFSQVYWSGVTTLELARFIAFAINNSISGLYHLSSQRVSKYDLLVLFGEVFDHRIRVHQDQTMRLDRSLRSQRADVEYRAGDLRELLMQLRDWMVVHPMLYTQKK